MLHHMHMLPPKRVVGGDPRQATEWLRDIVAENGEAKVPGPKLSIIQQQLTMERRTRELAGEQALTYLTEGGSLRTRRQNAILTTMQRTSWDP